MRKLAALFVALPSLALASGYSLPNTNPRDLALSASAAAAQNDAGAAYTLPAALGKLEGWSFRLSGGAVTLNTKWKDPGYFTGTSPDTSIKSQYTPLGNVYVGYGGRSAALGDRGWGVGLGVQPFGGSVVEWPSDWAGRYRIVKVNRQVFSGVLTGGVDVIPGVRLGGGLLYYYTTEELKQNAYMAPFAANPIDPTTWNPALPDAIGKIDANGGALSYDLSAEIQPHPAVPLTIGVDYKHKASQTLKGTADWQNLTPVAQALGNQGLTPFKNMDAQQELTIPNRFEVAAAYRVSKPVLVTAAWTLDRWVVYGKDVLKGANGYEINIPRNYSNGYTFRGGAEYDVAPAVTVRAGLQYDHSGLDPKFYSPTLPDATSWAGSLGATYRFTPAWSVDAGLFYAWFNEVKAEDPNPATPGTGIEPGIYPAGTLAPTTQYIASYEGTFRGTYNTTAFIFGVSVGWKPGAK